MLTHGRLHLDGLSASCEVTTTNHASGVRVSVATFNTQNVADLGNLYNAVLLADVDEDLLDLLEEQGFSLRSLLTSGPRDDITRSDATELAAAAVLVRADRWSPDRMHMPNVPKMSRAKSDSGIDVLEVVLLPDFGSPDSLEAGELLRIASVKHTVQTMTSNCVSKLKASLSENELSHTYIATQLRVIHDRLVAEGYSQAAAQRLFLFVRELSTQQKVQLTGVAVVDSGAVDDAEARIGTLLESVHHWHAAVVIGIPDIATLHEACA
jgi:hypothetical protein